MANTNLNLVRFNGFGCYLSSVIATWSIMNDGAASTALPAYATGEALEVVSTDNTQDTSTGTGIRTVQVIFITNAGAISSETKTLTGTTAVAMTNTSIARVLDLHALTVGSNGASIGVVSIQVAGAGAKRMSIPIGHKRAAPGRFTIPTGYIGVYRGFNLSNGTVTSLTSVSYRIEADINPLTGSLNENMYQEIDWAAGGPASGTLGNASPIEKGGRRIYLPEKATIRASAIEVGATGAPAAGFVFLELYPKPTT